MNRELGSDGVILEPHPLQFSTSPPVLLNDDCPHAFNSLPPTAPLSFSAFHCFPYN